MNRVGFGSDMRGAGQLPPTILVKLNTLPVDGVEDMCLA